MTELFDYLPSWLDWSKPLFIIGALLAATFYLVKIAHVALRGILRFLDSAVHLVRTGETQFELSEDIPAEIEFEGTSESGPVHKTGGAGRRVKLFGEYPIGGYSIDSRTSPNMTPVRKQPKNLVRTIYRAWLDGDVRWAKHVSNQSPVDPSDT